MNREIQSLQGKLLIIMCYIMIYMKWGVRVAFHGSCRASDYFLGKSELMEPIEEMTEAAS